MGMAGWQALQGLVVAVAIEFFPVQSDYTVPVYFAAAYHSGFGSPFPASCAYLLGACVFAVTVNFTSFYLIGQTGPIAYAVVGHAKTVLTIGCGLLLFPKEDT